jgi:transglutaminase-like putative cysteine protease
MNSDKKTPCQKTRRQSRKWITAVSILLILVIASSAAFFWYPKGNPANTITEMPEGLKELADHYMGIMQNLNSSATKAKIAPLLDASYNQTDIFGWEQTKLTFANDPVGWFEDPTQILAEGKGICAQWSEVYVSACLALGYPSRLVAAVDTGSWSCIHLWAEEYINGTWVHVDPSDRVWNNPSRYQSWDWGSGIGSTVKIYAFEDHAYYDVTAKYSVK